MDCNCSQEYCWSKIPQSAVVSRDEFNMPYKIRIQEKNWTVGPVLSSKKSVVITFHTWCKLCDDCMEMNGTTWEAYVPDKK
jgi:NMD protein affecting ribosome stability and mRNA decay